MVGFCQGDQSKGNLSAPPRGKARSHNQVIKALSPSFVRGLLTEVLIEVSRMPGTEERAEKGVGNKSAIGELPF